MANSYLQYRTAAAAARELLIAAAAKEWGVAPDMLTLKDGKVVGQDKEASIGAFVAAAAELPMPESPRLKDPSEFTVIGKELKARRDSAAKVNGTAMFAMDVQLDNQMVVAIKRTPRLGGKVASFDDTAASKIPGFIMAQALPNGAGVVAYAKDTWAAFQARDALAVEWDDSAAVKQSSAEIREELLAAVNAEPEFQGSQTDLATTNAALEKADKVVEREFYFPLLAHAPMEPLTATIEPLADGGVIMHDGAQGPTGNHQVMHQILEIPMEKIQVNTLYAGGFFGRRSNPASDYLVEVTLAFAMTDRSRPVKLVWSREDDITGGYFRPALAHKVRVGLDADGNIIGWDHRIAGQSIFKGTFFEEMVVHNGVDHSTVEGAGDTPYAIPQMHMGVTDAKPATTVNWWRSVGHSHTGYVMETIMDECATTAGVDPIEYRLRYLSGDTPDHKRMAGVIKLAAEKAGWSKALPDGYHRGFAVHKSFGSYVAEVCEVTRDDDGVFSIEKITAAVDCGVAVTPDVVRAQIEGGIGYGIGHVMRDEISLTDGMVTQSNFPNYVPLRMADIPAIDVHIVPSAEAPTGVGEPGTPPAGPALANAIAAASGERSTMLPMTSTGIRFS